MVFSVFSLVVLMIFPAYAAVDSFSLEKGFYTDEEQLVFVGIEDTGKKSVFIIVRGPSGNYIGMFSDPTSDNDGSFSTIPRTVETFFSTNGIYNATAFTDDENEKDGLTIKLEYDGNKISELEDFVLTLKTISDKTITEGKTLSFSAGVTDSSLDKLIFSLEKNPPSGASIDSNSGQFTWTPSTSQGNVNGIQYNFDIVVERGAQKDTESITITVKDPEVIPPKDEPKDEPRDEPKNEPRDEPKDLGIAAFVDPAKDPQSYVDRYNNEPSYKKWFDDNYSQYDSIKHAVGLEKPRDEHKDLDLAPFVDPAKDPHSYVDRYNNEPSYKKWFDDNYPEYDSIQQAVGIKASKEIAAFVDPNQDPQYYVDRYNNEPSYKKWFDDNFPEYDSIHEAVGLEESEVVPPKIGECGEGTKLVDGICTVSQPAGGGCLIATATYGSEMAPQVQHLREIRDNKVMSTESGASFMGGFNQFYYSFSPAIADYERENPLFKEVVKVGLTPLMSSLSILDHAESENEILAYGVSLIILNIGMYVAAPAIVVYKTRKFVKI
ncbi:MAG: Ig domain-containing protein [Nitrosopumilus sp.]|nr:Ig domain-containing protein [Nitrosopumilus sp.]